MAIHGSSKHLIDFAEWYVDQVPLYILLSRWFMIIAGFFVVVGTLSSIGLRKAFSHPPYPKPTLLMKWAGLEFVFGGKYTTVIICSVLNNCARVYTNAINLSFDCDASVNDFYSGEVLKYVIDYVTLASFSLLKVKRF